jgi:uncharacterized lipoprotein YddW (UPF0748 family)
VTDLVERIAVGVRMRKPTALMTAAVFSNDEDAFTQRFQDWKLWLERGLLDALCPMAYTPDTEIFKRRIEKAKSSAKGHQVWAGIGSYQMPVEGTIEKIEAARSLGVEGVVLFSYDSMAKSSKDSSVNYFDNLKSTVFGLQAEIPTIKR